jgi:PAS domain S-box-containing protein
MPITSKADEQDDFAALVETAPAMLWLGDTEGRCIFLNKELRSFWGVGDLNTFDWALTIHPEDRDQLSGPYLLAMQTRSPFETEARYRRWDGAYRVLRTAARPRFSSTGTFMGMAGVNTDVTDQRRAEGELRQSSEQLQLALDAAQGIGTWVWDVQRDLVFADRRFARAFKVDEQAAASGLPLQTFVDAIFEEDRTRVAAEIEKARRVGGLYRCEYRVLRPDGTLQWLLASGRCEVDADGRPTSFPGCVIDISDRKEHEDKLQLLTREMSHRIKNTLAVVQAITSMTAREHPEASAAFSELASRFSALDAAYACVRPSNEEGVAFGSLKQLLQQLFEPYSIGERPRVIIAGEDVLIGAKAASALALIFHERATNAAKHGALSGDGTVRLSIESTRSALNLRWVEQGGPALSGAPSAQGFGSQLIGATARSLSAAIEISWRMEGLDWKISLPLEVLSQ